MQLDGDEEDDKEEVISLLLSSIVLHVKVPAAARTIMWHAAKNALMKVFIVKEEVIKLLSGGGWCFVGLYFYYYYLFAFRVALQLCLLFVQFFPLACSDGRPVPQG